MAEPAQAGLEREGRRLFGRIAASACHDIGNALAAIAELAGLQSDCAAAAREGAAIPLEKWESIAERIAAKTAQCRELTQSLNRFAHGIADSAEGVALGPLAHEIAGLARRPAARGRVELRVAVRDEGLVARCDPFGLRLALYGAFEGALERAPAGTALEIAVSRDAGAGRIAIRGVGEAPEQAAAALRAIMESLGGGAEARRAGPDKCEWAIWAPLE